MKAIPFICSRTKYVDFLPEYLVRPADFDWQSAKKMVGNAMYDLNTLDDIRYAVFSVGEYCVFGIACISKTLVKKINFPIDEEYLRDKGNRSLACFMGFAVKCSGESNVIPKDIVSDKFLNQCCKVYFYYLIPVWDKASYELESKLLHDNDSFELDDEQADDKFKKPESEEFDKINVIKYNKDNLQQVINYFLDSIINKKNKDDSFISHVLYPDQWEDLNFKNAMVSESLYKTLDNNCCRKTKEKYNECLNKCNGLKLTVKSISIPEFENKDSFSTSNEIGSHIIKIEEYESEIKKVKTEINKDFGIQELTDCFSNLNSKYLSEEEKNKVSQCIEDLKLMSESIEDTKKKINEILTGIPEKKNALLELKETYKKREQEEKLLDKISAYKDKISNGEHISENEIKKLSQEADRLDSQDCREKAEELKTLYDESKRKKEQSDNAVWEYFVECFLNNVTEEKNKKLECYNDGYIVKGYEFKTTEKMISDFLEIVAKNIKSFKIKNKEIFVEQQTTPKIFGKSFIITIKEINN